MGTTSLIDKQELKDKTGRFYTPSEMIELFQSTAIEKDWSFIEYKPSEHITVEKGSITVNGVSLTVVNSKSNQFSVCIIPYTFEHTVFGEIKVGDQVNLEFDIIGKYVARLMGKTSLRFEV